MASFESKSKINYADLDASLSLSWEEMEYRPTAVAVLKNQDGEILVIKPVKDPEAWIFPQGGVDRNEKVKDGLQRELFEELGLQPDDFNVEQFLESVEMDSESGRADMRGFTKGKRFISFSVTCLNGDKIRLDPEEIMEFRWISDANVLATIQTSRPEKTELLRRIFQLAGS